MTFCPITFCLITLRASVLSRPAQRVHSRLCNGLCTCSGSKFWRPLVSACHRTFLSLPRAVDKGPEPPSLHRHQGWTQTFNSPAYLDRSGEVLRLTSAILENFDSTLHDLETSTDRPAATTVERLVAGQLMNCVAVPGGLEQTMRAGEPAPVAGAADQHGV